MGSCAGKQQTEVKIRANKTYTSTLSLPLAFTNSSPLRKHLEMKDVYILKSLIGKGTFGIVRKAVHKDNKDLTVAIKTIPKTDSQLDYSTLHREIEILKSIDHPNIIKFYDFFDDPSHLHIVMEMCTGGELFDRIVESGTICESKAAQYLKKVMGAVNHLHLLGICHRDLKPQNFLFENKSEDAELKIIDFGLSNKFNNTLGTAVAMKTFVGTPYYIAPEILLGNYDIKCDLWSLGVTMYVMLTGEYPFAGENQHEVFTKISSSSVEMDMRPVQGLSKAAVDLLKKLLIKNPQFRIDAKEAIKHPWFKEAMEEHTPLSNDVLDMLRDYTPPSKIYKAAMRVIVKYLSIEDLKGLRDMFYQVDTENLGYITLKEVKQVFAKAGSALPQKQLKKIFADLSTNNDGKIYYSDFITAAFSNKKILDENQITWAFKLFDTNTSGKITADGLRRGMTRLSKPEDGRKINKLATDALSANKAVNFEQFKEILRRSPKSTNNS